MGEEVSVTIHGYAGTTSSIDSDKLEEMDDEELKDWAERKLKGNPTIHDVSHVETGGEEHHY